MFRSASFFIGTSFTVAVFTIFATSNVDSIVGVPRKIYSMQRILINKKADLFVKYAHLHPWYAANLVARGRYYHCHWTLLRPNIKQFNVITCQYNLTYWILVIEPHVMPYSLWLSVAIWHLRSWSRLDKVMAWCRKSLVCTYHKWRQPELIVDSHHYRYGNTWFSPFDISKINDILLAVSKFTELPILRQCIRWLRLQNT